MEGRTSSARTTVIRCLLVLILLTLTGNLLWFTWTVDNGVVRNDYWRMVHLIDLFSEGSLNFEELLAQSNGPIKSPFTAIVPLVDGLLFGLEIKGIHIAAVILRLLAAAALVSLGAWSGKKGQLPVVLAAGAGAVVVLSPALFGMLAHGQASLSIIRSSLYVIFFAFLAKHLTSGRPRPIGTVALSAMLCFLILVVAGSWVVTFAGAALACIALGAAFGLFDTASKRRSAATITTQLVGFSLAAAWLYLKTKGSLPKESILEQPWNATVFFFSMLGDSLLTKEVAKMVAPSAPAFIAVGCLGLVIYGLWRTPIRTMGAVHLFGTLLLVYSLGTIALITIARTANGSPLSARYLADSMLWQVGLLQLLVAAPSRDSGPRFVARARWGVLVTLVAAILTCNWLAARRQWEMAPALQRSLERRAAVLHRAETLTDQQLRRQLRETPRLHNHYVRRGLEVMRKHELNVFRPQEMLEPDAQKPAD